MLNGRSGFVNMTLCRHALYKDTIQDGYTTRHINVKHAINVAKCIQL